MISTIYPSNENWHLIHDFLYGWGYTDVRFKVRERCIFFEDLHLIGLKKLEAKDCDAVYIRLEPEMVKKRAAIAKWVEEHPFVMPDKLSIPLIKVPFPQLSAKDLCEAQPMSFPS